MYCIYLSVFTVSTKTVPQYASELNKATPKKVAYFKETLSHPGLDQEIKNQTTAYLAQLKGAGYTVEAIDSTKMKDEKELPATMKSYIEFINSYLGVPVKYVSNGPGRDQIVHL